RTPSAFDVLIAAAGLPPELRWAFHRRHPRSLSVAFALLEALPLLARRYRPDAVLAVVLAAAVAADARFDAPNGFIAVAVALYSIAASSPRSEAVLGGATAVTAL